jgi:hypothetical protein
MTSKLKVNQNVIKFNGKQIVPQQGQEIYIFFHRLTWEFFVPAE